MNKFLHYASNLSVFKKQAGSQGLIERLTTGSMLAGKTTLQPSIIYVNLKLRQRIGELQIMASKKEWEKLSLLWDKQPQKARLDMLKVDWIDQKKSFEDSEDIWTRKNLASLRRNAYTGSMVF